MTIGRPGPTEAPDELEHGRWVRSGCIVRWEYDEPAKVSLALAGRNLRELGHNIKRPPAVRKHRDPGASPLKRGATVLDASVPVNAPTPDVGKTA